MNKERKARQKKIWDSLKRHGFCVDVLPYGNIKIDTDTTLEQLFNVLIGTGFLFSIIIGLNYTLIELSIPLLFLAAGITGRIFTDNYFIFDFINKNMRYHFSCFGFKKETVKFSFSHIMALSVDCRKENKKYPSFEYGPVLFTKSGEKIILSDSWYKKPEDINNVVECLAEELEVPFFPGQEEKRPVFKQIDINTCDISFEYMTFYKRLKGHSLYIFIIVLLIIILLCALFVSQSLRNLYMVN